MPAQLTEDLITDELGFDQSIEPGVIDRLHRQMSRLTEDVAHLIEGEVASVDGDSEKTESSDEITARRQLISFVIPAHDEQDTIVELCQRISACTPQEHDIEIILIDDGSKDATWSRIEELSEGQQLDSRTLVRGIRMRLNAGKAAGLTAGFRTCRGDLVFTMDADLQDDPTEIPRFIEAIEAGADVVTGWKQKRFDPWHKVWPSRVFNKMLSALTGVKLHDHNCGFKCYRAEVVKRVIPHGELHRMMPCLAATHGFKTVEIAVAHSPRRHGVSKYGFERYARGASDMLTMAFLMRFGQRPAHFFNGFAMLYCVLGVAVAGSGWWIGPMSRLGVTAFLAGGLLLAMGGVGMIAGFVSELMIRDGRLERRELPISETVVSQN
ncbi:MAG: glycosyltransferase family 2 protein [Lacipirellulaceae bacterium]